MVNFSLSAVVGLGERSLSTQQQENKICDLVVFSKLPSKLLAPNLNSIPCEDAQSQG